MKKIHTIALAIPLAMMLSCSSNSYAYSEHEGFIAGACALAAGLVGVAGAVALADWCCSETDDQLIARVDAECRSINSTYNEVASYFLRSSGMDYYLSASYKPYNTISETVLYEFGTYVWNGKSSQYAYRTGVIAAKKQLRSSVQSLRKRIHSLEGKSCKYEDQKRLSTMRRLLNGAEELLVHIALFADCLEHHISYFNLYDSVDTVRMRYLQEITIFESGHYAASVDLKRSIVSRYGGQYPLRSFVNDAERDIATLRSGIYSLAYTYEMGRQYANRLINYLIDIKSIVMNDPRYAQELYEWEQARLQRLQLEALEAQARLEAQRLNAMMEQNRILERRNRLEQEKMLYNAQQRYGSSDADLHVNVNISI